MGYRLRRANRRRSVRWRDHEGDRRDKQRSEWDWLLHVTWPKFQLHMWRHIDVQADWRSWTFGRALNAIDILEGSLTCLSNHQDGTFLFVPKNRPLSRLLRHAGHTEDLFSYLRLWSLEYSCGKNTKSYLLRTLAYTKNTSHSNYTGSAKLELLLTWASAKSKTITTMDQNFTLNSPVTLTNGTKGKVVKITKP